ncbi:MAG TPA: hypothetical protein DF712_03910 [Balneola sp.]|nr:hypothetical protein [Balneola sp.]
MSKQRQLEGGVEEARDLVQKKTKDLAKKAALGAVLYSADKVPGSGKVKDFFKPKYTKIADKIDKIPGDISVNIDPEEKQVSVGWKIKW